MITIELMMANVNEYDVRYVETGARIDGEEIPGTVVGALYVQRTALELLDKPETLTVTFSEGATQELEAENLALKARVAVLEEENADLNAELEEATYWLSSST